jgi:2'-5' RNA ligase
VIRLFAAIAMPHEIALALAERAQGVPGAAWRPAESLHLTLRFAGDIAETLAADLESELALIGAAPFDLTLEGVGAFGAGEDVRALWAGVSASEPLRRLARRCETAARRAGLPAERRAWRPHVTLAYVRRADPSKVAAWVQAHNLLRSAPFRVARFGLYSSRLGAGGSTYAPERLYPLV